MAKRSKTLTKSEKEPCSFTDSAAASSRFCSMPISETKLTPVSGGGASPRWTASPPVRGCHASSGSGSPPYPSWQWRAA
eukprot:4229727-Pyramimonas_sp.AAC.1